MDDLQFALLLTGFSVLPPLLFLAWVRNHERESPEPWRAVLKSFLYGAVVGTTVALILNTLFDTAAYQYGLGAGLGAGVLTAVVAAPFIEEATKGMGLGTQRRMIGELEDGLVYGAAIGLGFAATENLLYGISAWLEEGSNVAIQTVVLRSVSSTILHAGTTSLIGFAYGRSVLTHGMGLAQVMPAYLLAVLVHAAYNLLVGFGTWMGLILAVVIAWMVLNGTRRKIRRLDALPHEP